MIFAVLELWLSSWSYRPTLGCKLGTFYRNNK